MKASGAPDHIMASRERDRRWHWKAVWYSGPAWAPNEVKERRGTIPEFDDDEHHIQARLRAAVGYPHSRPAIEIYW